MNGNTVGYDALNGVRVSTVHLPIDHGWGGKPLWYETMVFPGESANGGYLDIYCERYETLEEAVAGHAVVVEKVRNGEITAAGETE